MPLDLLCNVILTFSVIILFLLFLGLPLVKGIKTNKNLKRHGILAALAVILQTTLFLTVMVPSFANHFKAIISLSPMYAVNAWLHFAVGSAAIISGFAYMGLWLAFSSSQMRCIRAKKFMLPTLIIWAVAIVTGGLIHLLQMF